MKIAWFTPFSRNSAIGYYSKLACEALEKHHDVTIYTHSYGDLLESSVNVEIFNGADIGQRLSDYDEVFYNLGDNSDFHAGIYEVACNFAGIMILHDVTYLNFFTNYYIHYLNQRDEWKKLITQYYGESAANEILMAINSFEDWNNIDFLCYNCLDIITRKAKGVIVHSRYHEKILSSSYFGPTHVIYFPYISKQSKAFNSKKSSKELKLLTVGNVNRNKRIVQIIKAIGGNEQLRANIKYTIAGKLDNGSYEKELRKAIKDNNLEDNICLEGTVSPERLNSLYEEADALANLRKPAIEGASWSLVEQMELGKPIIVNKIGFYDEIPDDSLLKIVDNGESEIESITKAILWLLENPEEAKKMGDNAKKYVQETFTPQSYVTQIELFLDRMKFLKPLDQLVKQIINEFTAYGVSEDMSICQLISDEIENMFGKIEGSL